MAPTKEAVLRNMRRLYKSYVRDCRRRNVYWELTIDQFHKLTSAPCVYCQKLPAQISRAYIYNGIDRTNPKQGYMMSNVVTACRGCNQMKSDKLSFDEMKVVGEALRVFRESQKKMG